MDHLQEEEPAVYMNFFDWMSKSSRKKCLESYDEYWVRLNQYFGLFTRRPMSNHVLQQIRRVCPVPTYSNATIFRQLANYVAKVP